MGHAIHFSVDFNENLEGWDNGHAIESNWRVNHANQKLGKNIEKWVIIQDGKV